MKSFLERIETDVLVGDGGTGSLLMQAYHDLSCAERANLAYPQTVTDIHLRFIAAGSQLIETNTFGANRFKLEIHGDSAESVRQLNSAAVKLARDANGSSPHFGSRRKRSRSAASTCSWSRPSPPRPSASSRSKRSVQFLRSPS